MNMSQGAPILFQEDLVLQIMACLNHCDQRCVAVVSTEAWLMVKLARENGIIKNEVLGIAAGREHTAVCTSDGVFTFGNGARGRLGHGLGLGESTPRMVKGPLVGKEVKGVATGLHHTVVWTIQGEAFSFGYGGMGQLGHGYGCFQRLGGCSAAMSGTQNEMFPRLIEGPMIGEFVLGAAAGDLHTILWTDKGDAFSFGLGSDGRLGHGVLRDEVFPRRVEGPAVTRSPSINPFSWFAASPAERWGKVVGAAAGDHHTLLWTDDGLLYSCGACQPYGNLGHDANGERNQEIPRLVRGGLSGRLVLGATTGCYHSIAWTMDGDLYSFGLQGSGNLGYRSDVDQTEPKLIADPFLSRQVVGAVAGAHHTVFWTKAGAAFSFGYGDDGELGFEFPPSIQIHEERVRIGATPIAGPLEGKHVVGGGAGVHHTALYTKAGEVYAFGVGAYGNLGNGSCRHEWVPREIHLVAGVRGASSSEDSSSFLEYYGCSN